MAQTTPEQQRTNRSIVTIEDGTRMRGPGFWWCVVLGVGLMLLGLGLGAGGVWLLILGGSWYYLAAGIGLLISGGLIAQRNSLGAWIYVLTWLVTVVWAYFEIGFDGWGMLPRDLSPTILLLIVLATLPALRRRRFYWIGSRSSAAAIILVALAVGFQYTPDDVALAQDNAAATADKDNTPVTPTSDENTQNKIGQTAQAGTTTIAATGVAIATAPTQDLKVGADWPVYGGTDLGKRYSPLNQITPQNVAQLQKVWTYHTGDMPSGPTKDKYSPENTPIKIGDRLFMCSPMNIAIAVDAKTGTEIWRHDPEVSPDAIPYGATCRGVAYYHVPNATEGQPCAQRIIETTLDARMIALDAGTGQACADFGQNGQVDLNDGIGKKVPGWYAVDAPPIIVRGVVVVGAQVKDVEATEGPSGVIRGYDAVTGKLAWAWDMMHPDRQGPPPAGETYARGTPNMWTEPAADPELGYVYLPMGNTSVDYWGGNRAPEEIKYSSAIVAVDVTTGRPVWHFQTVHYDVWDYDLGSQPSLIDFPGKNGPVPAMILPSKTGQIYLLNRKTGEPLAPVTEKPVPTGGVEPENLSKTQPYSDYAHLDQPDLTEADMWGATPIDQLICRIQFRRAAYQGEYTPPTADRPFIEYPSYNGGSDWGSMAVDEQRGIAVANYNDVAMYDQLIPRAEADKMGLKPITERNPGEDGKADYGAQTGAPYAIHTNAGWRLPTGLPCTQPPFGRIRAFDIKSGKTLWDKPFGTAVNNGPFGIPSHLPLTIGTPNNGGPIITGSGLIFIAATTDDMLRAYDLKSGKILWQTKLPGGGQANPLTYEVDGRQFIVIAPGGHHFMHTKISDAVVAYALP